MQHEIKRFMEQYGVRDWNSVVMITVAHSEKFGCIAPDAIERARRVLETVFGEAGFPAPRALLVLEDAHINKPKAKVEELQQLAAAEGVPWWAWAWALAWTRAWALAC